MGIESRLEGEDTQYLIAKSGDLVNATFFPSPHFGRDIIVDLGFRQMSTAELRYTEVKGRIVNEDQRVGFLIEECLLSNAEITADLTEISQYRRKAHKRHLANMLI